MNSPNYLIVEQHTDDPRILEVDDAATDFETAQRKADEINARGLNPVTVYMKVR
jgi:hypothetical protein